VQGCLIKGPSWFYKGRKEEGKKKLIIQNSTTIFAFQEIHSNYSKKGLFSVQVRCEYNFVIYNGRVRIFFYASSRK
jgi:hypothetical protein